MPRDPRLRFRVWVAAELVDEAWLDTSNPDSGELFERIRARHSQLVEQAERAGQLWLVESYDPEKPVHQAFQRVGTDVDGMVAPQPLGFSPDTT